jgi:hypothetical protein
LDVPIIPRIGHRNADAAGPEFKLLGQNRFASDYGDGNLKTAVVTL